MHQQTYLPPEWALQSAVMLTWPHANNKWYPSLSIVEESFIAIAKAVVAHEKLIIACLDEAHVVHIQSRLTSANISLTQISFYVAPSNDVWARDHGPITVIQDNAARLLDFNFNGWGDKYPSNLDNQVTLKLYQQHAFGKTPIQSIHYVLEGGSVEVDGKGTLLTTTSCLLSEARNPDYSQADVENLLKKWLGIDRILWLHHGYLAGDDTDGHIDTLARFTDAHTITYVKCDDPHDEHYAELALMEAELKTFQDYEGKPYRLVPLPWPSGKYAEDGYRLPATYANFLIINNAVLVPTYEDSKDQIALDQLKKCFPGRSIIPVPCRHVIEQYGSLHCVTMQIPAEVSTV